MKRAPFIIMALILLVEALGGCTVQESSTDRLVIATSIEPLAGFIEKIGGEKVEVLVMVPAGADPHTYEPMPDQMKSLSRAVMYASVGAGLEFELVYLDKLFDINPHMLKVDCSDGIDLLQETSGTEERSLNPHYWLSPRNALRVISNLCDGLVQIDPDNRVFYKENCDAYAKEITALDNEISTGLSGVKNRYFMDFHPAWTYFAQDYNLREIAIEVEGKEPGAQSMADLIDIAKLYNVKVVFVSPQFNQKSAEAIAQAIGGRVVMVDSLARDYVPNMRYVFNEMLRSME